jgi:hypothetical protein
VLCFEVVASNSRAVGKQQRSAVNHGANHHAVQLMIG